jgi:hypothetical protein
MSSDISPSDVDNDFAIFLDFANLIICIYMQYPLSIPQKCFEYGLGNWVYDV